MRTKSKVLIAALGFLAISAAVITPTVLSIKKDDGLGVDLNLDNLINKSKELNTIDSVNNAINNPLDFIKDTNILDPMDMITNTTITPTVNNGKVELSVNIELSNGKDTTVNVPTNLNAIVFDNQKFASYIKTIDDTTKLDALELLNTIVNSNAGVTSVDLLNSDLTNATQLPSPGTMNDLCNSECYNYDFNIVLGNDNYCFFNNSKISNSLTVSKVVSKVVIPTEIGNLDIKNALESNFKSITIDNYQEYFEGADNKPSDPKISGVKNSGKMTASMLSKLSNGLLPEDAINNIVITKSGNTDDGYLNVNIEIQLSDKYQYNGQNVITINDLMTGMFDPNSDFNLSLFDLIYDNTQLRNFNYQVISDNNVADLYLPYTVTIGAGGVRFLGQDLINTINSINFTYSSWRECQYPWGDFEYIKSKNIIANNSDLVLVYEEGGSGNEFSNSPVENVQITNCQNVTGINNNTFKNCYSLVSANFDGCPITKIGSLAFWNCSSLTNLDVSSTTLDFVHQDAFVNCTSLKTIYVKDEASKQLIQQALPEGSACQVLIK